MDTWQRLLDKSVATLSVFLAAALICSAVTAKERTPKPSVAYFEDAAQGRKIRRANYESAVDTLKESQPDGAAAFFSATNLCVSYLKLGELRDAREACNVAVEQISTLAGSEAFRKARYAADDRGRFMAVALSNRGVVNAADGRTALARADFEAAIEAYEPFDEARENLNWLASR